MQPTDLVLKLNRALHLASRSLESYLPKMSDPILGEKGQREFAAALEKVTEAEAGQVEAIEEMILDLGGVPDHGSFGMKTAYYNYLSPDYVIGLMRGELGKMADALDGIAAELGSEPGARAAVKALADRKREQLVILESVKLPERKAVMAVMPKITPPFAPAKKPSTPGAPLPAAVSAPAPAPGGAPPPPKPAK